MTEAISQATDFAVQAKTVVEDESFLCVAGQDLVPVRDRRNTQSANLKKPELLAPSELRAAIRLVIEKHIGVHSDEVITTVARLLGFGTTTARLREIIDQQL